MKPFSCVSGFVNTAAICLAGLLLAGCSATVVEKPGSRDLLEARAASNTANTAEAIAKYESALASASDQRVLANARRELGVLYLADHTNPANRERGIELLRAAASTGDRTSAYTLAHDMTSQGLYKEAAEYLRPVTVTMPRAVLKLARIIMQGHVPATGPDEVETLISQAMASFHAHALVGEHTSSILQLGQIYRLGEFVPKDPVLSEKFYRQAIAAGEPLAVVGLAQLWLTTDEPVLHRKSELMLADAAARNIPDAKRELALHRLTGKFGPHDAKAELDALRQVAALGDPLAMYALADVLAAPNSEISDPAEALEWARRSAAIGFGKAEYWIANAHLDGVGTPRDVQAAILAYDRAEKRGVTSGSLSVRLGKILMDPGSADYDPDRAASYLEFAAEKGSATAHVLLADLYSDSRYSKASPERAFFHKRTAAEAGIPGAYQSLALAYRDGIGTEPSPEQFLLWQTKSAEAGQISAMLQLGYSYAQGKGVARNNQKANGWFEKVVAEEPGYAARIATTLSSDDLADASLVATWNSRAAKTGDENSAYRLARELEIAGNLPEAFKWWRKAADLGNTIAIERVGLAYLNGTGVEKDLAKSQTYLEAAAADGRVIPLLKLAKAYSLAGNNEDVAQAANLYKIAAEHGNAIGQYKYGMANFHGQGVEKNLIVARGWLVKANNQSYGPAKIGLRTLDEAEKS